MISLTLLAVTLFRFFLGQVNLELLPFIAECVTNIKNKTNLTLLSEFRLSDARATPAAPLLIRYFKLNTTAQDGPLCKNGNLWHLYIRI